MQQFLDSSHIIDWQHPDVLKKAIELANGEKNPAIIAKTCFEFVRDKIKHSLDFQLNPVTCTASEALKYKSGFCFAKSHLLAALLRANNIPAGLCYQRLTIKGNTPPFCLHGLNAVFLPKFGWYRIDARGNKPGIEAVFSPPVERLAYKIQIKGEMDLPEVWPDPLSQVIKLLEMSTNYQEVAENLPDIELIKSRSWFNFRLR